MKSITFLALVLVLLAPHAWALGRLSPEVTQIQTEVALPEPAPHPAPVEVGTPPVDCGLQLQFFISCRYYDLMSGTYVGAVTLRLVHQPANLEEEKLLLERKIIVPCTLLRPYEQYRVSCFRDNPS